MLLQIPDSAIEGITLLSNLTDETINAIFDVFEKVKPGLDWTDVTRDIEDTEKFKVGEIESILQAIRGLYAVQIEEARPVGNLVEDVIESIKESEKLKDKINPESLRIRLKKALSYEETLGITAKALGIMLQHEHVMVDARILTDIRPVFTTDSTQAPPAVTIVHNMKLSYLKDGNVNTFYMALDSKDLIKIQEVLERALNKEKQLPDLCENSKTIVLR